MSDLYSVIPGLTPTADEIVAAELLAKQVLEAEFPNLDLREGTGLRDLVLRPTAFAMALLKKANDYYFTNNSLAGVTDDTDTEIVDDILSNWFLTRNTGSNAVISARLYFAVSKNITIPSSTYFSTDGKLKFFPAQTLTFSANALSYDNYQNEWYIDVQLIAESTGADYNIGEGSLLYFNTFDPYFLHAEINYLAQSATDAETNSQFIARAENAISTRNLINDPSIISNLQAAFNTLQRITPVGMGDINMIRDQVKVIFDPEDPRVLTSLSQTAGLATGTLPDHGFEVGQVFSLTGTLPVGYDGQYTIISKDANSFQFIVSDTLSPVTSLPLVQSVTAPCLVHAGGKVDVYCGDTVGIDIVQVTTDSVGKAVLEGPIYEFERSSVSGGSTDDMIPFTNTFNLTGSTLDTTSKKLSVTTDPAHNLTSGSLVTVNGIRQTKPITSLSCTNLVVTVTSASHGLSNGMKVTVEGVNPTTYNGTFQITVIDANTFTYVVSANILTTGSGSAMLISNPSVEGEFAITYTGLTTFDVSMPDMWGTATNDISELTISHSVPYSVSNPYLQTKTLLSLTGNGTTATATLNNHGYAINRYITITGATPNYYNGTWKITSVPNANQFTFSTTDTLLTDAAGTISSQAVIPWNDYGFSEKQKLVIDFGVGYPNATASFQTRFFTEVSGVQSYLDSPDNHVLCGDYLARGYNIYILDIDVVVYNGTSPSTDLVYDATAKFLTGLPAGSTLVLNDLVAALNSAGISGIQTPLGVKYTYYHRDLITPKTGSVVDYLDPLDNTSVFILGQVTTSSLNV